jgi:hypothetical protein
MHRSMKYRAVLAVIGAAFAASLTGSAIAAAPKTVTIPASAAPQARAYIVSHESNAKLVADYEAVIQKAVANVQSSPLMTPLQQSTQATYTKIGRVIPKLEGPFAHDTLGSVETQVFTQAKAIKASMHALLEYAAFPTQATLTAYTTLYQNAVLAWNKAVRAIWRAANTAGSPTICTTC